MIDIDHTWHGTLRSVLPMLLRLWLGRSLLVTSPMVRVVLTSVWNGSKVR